MFNGRRRYRRARYGGVPGGPGSAVLAGLVVAYAAFHLHTAHAPAGAAGHEGAGGAAHLSSSTDANVALGERMAARRGWAGGEWACLDALWTRESGWDAYAANPVSDARGIPQDINGWTAYAPGDAAAQIRWGLDYITGRYRTPCAAWNHETTFGWY